jgi:erythromycin esterase-like protein
MPQHPEHSLAKLLMPLALLACSPPQDHVAPSTEALAKAALPLADHGPLLQAIGDARFVIMGEMTHGTHEFYLERARLTERLVRDRGFGAVVIEGDQPAAERVNRYVRGLGADRSAAQALQAFTNFPRWMWRNAEFSNLVERLRTHNQALPPERRVGVYGMDVYNLSGAIDAVIAYLERNGSAAQARAQYRCFAPYRADPHRYGAAARRRSCRAAAEAVLTSVRGLPRPADPVAAEARFSAIGSAATVAGAEEYFRELYSGTSAWNARDRRMTSTVEEIAEHVGALAGPPGRVVVWAHNSHVGDARATDAADRGEINLGQVLRERHGPAAFLLGFLTYTGSVIAAEQWDAPERVRTLRPALPGSDAARLHEAGVAEGLLLLRARHPAASLLEGRRPQRAVGVIYQPHTERQSHYFHADLRRQFDAVIHIDRTRALTPLR